MITRLFAMICLVIVSAGVLRGQTSAERSAFNNLEKHRWDKVRSNVKKALRKDSLSVTAHYITSIYFFTPENPDSQIDSAYTFCMHALALYPRVDGREREKLNRIPLDSAVLVNLRRRIDSVAFDRAMHINTEASYINFLASFLYASQRERAEELRDEVAYLDAMKVNTYQSFYAYLTKYPKAERAVEARRKYEKLLFASLTADKKLESYEAFIREYPESPYREDALDEIFEISTASGEMSAFINFLDKYSKSKKVKLASDILFHLQLENHSDEMISSDSLKTVQSLLEGYLVPFLRDDQFGMMNSEGVDVLKRIGTEIDPVYLCGNILEDLVVTKNSIVARNGAIIYKGEIDEVDDLGYGFLLITKDSCAKLVHKSGHSLSANCLEDAKILSGQILATKSEDKWALWSLAGRVLTEYDFQEVKQIGKVVALRQKDQWFLKSIKSIGNLANGVPLSLTESYDAVEPWYSNKIWTKKNDTESILSDTFDFVIPSSNQKLSTVFFGVLGITNDSQTLYNKDLIRAGNFKGTKMYDPWTGVQVAEQWQLFDVQSKDFISTRFDSLSFIGSVAVGFLRDSMHVFFRKDIKRSFSTREIKFLPGKDSVSFIIIPTGDAYQLFNSKGEKLFNMDYDQIQYLGDGIFIAEKKKKKGLVINNGKNLLPLEYDGIGGISVYKTIPILKSMKFGIFNVASKKLIKPTYDKNIVPYGSKFLIAYKDGAYGFITWENKLHSKFEFEEIRYWNDSVAWVKKDFQWMLYEVETKIVRLENVKNYKLIKDTSEEKVAIVHEDTAYGVISNKKGVIIPSTFSDIVNIGSAEKPFYLTEKFVEEASLFVVIYYNHEGKFLRRQAYEADDYERIYCSN